MTDNVSLMSREGFDLDTAVFFATLAQLAYDAAPAIDAAVKALGFESAQFFDLGDVQGYWCSGPDAALLVFRGTNNPGQWLRDVRFLPAAHPWGHVHLGFRDGLDAVDALLAPFDAAAAVAKHVWITGHSLGGALALLAGARCKIKLGKAPLVHTYGQPAVGLNDFAERFSAEMPGRLWRFVNQVDIVTRVPPAPLYRHVGIVKRIVKPGLLEGVVAAAPPQAPLDAPRDLARELIVGGSALEATRAAAAAGLVRPLLTELPPLQMADAEFAKLQLALNAAVAPGLESIIDWLPWLSDHAIGEYIRLLGDIRAHPAG